MLSNIIIKNGIILDPGNNREEIGNLYISNGRIVEPYANDKADWIFDASSQYVLPGLIDYHTHIFPGATEIGINADLSFLPQGVTTAVDAGSAGVSNMESFIENIPVRHSMRIKAFINLSPTGLTTMKYHENVNPKYWDKKKLKYFIDKYPDIIEGLKIRISKDIVGDLGISVLSSAIEVAEELHTRLVVHVTNPPETMDRVADLLRKGDVLAHCFHGTGHTILGSDGKVLPQLQAAQKRGVIMDAANGGNHWSFAVAEAALSENFLPDIISTDITVKTIFKDPVFSLPFLMSKYLTIGMKLSDVVKSCTVTPAKVLGISNEVGNLSIGSRADVAIFSLQEKETIFTDTLKQTRTGSRMLLPQLTACNGKIVYRSLES